MITPSERAQLDVIFEAEQDWYAGAIFLTLARYQAKVSSLVQNTAGGMVFLTDEELATVVIHALTDYKEVGL